MYVPCKAPYSQARHPDPVPAYLLTTTLPHTVTATPFHVAALGQRIANSGQVNTIGYALSVSLFCLADSGQVNTIRIQKRYTLECIKPRPFQSSLCGCMRY